MSYEMPSTALHIESGLRGNVLALSGRNSLPMTHTTDLCVPFIKENDTILPLVLNKTTEAKAFPEACCICLRQSYLQRCGRIQALLR